MCVLYKWDLRQNNILVSRCPHFRVYRGTRGSYCTAWIPHMMPQIRHNFHYFLKIRKLSELDDSGTGVKNLNTRQILSTDEEHTHVIHSI